MPIYKFQEGDAVCSVVSAADGKYRAQVRVSGLKLQPPQSQEYRYDSEALFDEKVDAMHHAIDHLNENFPSNE